MPKAGSKSREDRQLRLIRHIVHPVRKRHRLAFYLHLAHMLRHCAVGQQHKLFNQLVRLLTFFYNNADRLAGFIQLEAHF